MLQSLAEGDQLPRLVRAGLAPCGKREDTLRFITVVIQSFGQRTLTEGILVVTSKPNTGFQWQTSDIYS